MTALRQQDFFPDHGGQLAATVSVLSQSYIWFYPRLVPLAGGHKGALLLASLLHWTRRIHASDPQRDGWVWKSANEWLTETGLTRHEQDAAKAELGQRNLLMVAKRGMPSRTYYRLDIESLAITLNEMLRLPEARRIAWTWENSASMLQLLGRPTAFYSRLAGLLSNATDALHLSYLIQSQRTHFTSAITSDWISPRAALVEERIGLSYKQQLASRKRLSSSRLIDQRMSNSMTPKPELRIHFTRIAELLNKAKIGPISSIHQDRPRGSIDATSQGVGPSHTLPSGCAASQGDGSSITKPFVDAEFQGGGPSTTPPKVETAPQTQPSEQEFPFSANRNLPNRQTGNAQTGKQEFPFSADMIAEKGSLYIYKKHTELQPQNVSLFGNQGTPAPSGGGGEIDFTGLEQQWRAQGLQLLNDSGLQQELQQAVADEWIGRFTDQRQSPLGYPLRYLQALIGNAQTGTFVPELGVAVSTARASRQRAQRMLARSAVGTVEMPKPANRDEAQAEGVSSAVVQAERAKLKVLAQQFKVGIQRQGGGSSTTPPQVDAAVQGDGSSITPPQVDAAVQGVGSTHTPPQTRSLIGRLKSGSPDSTVCDSVLPPPSVSRQNQ